VLFNVIGIAPICTGLLLLINHTFVSNPVTYKYKVEKIYIESDLGYEPIGVVLENNFFSDEKKIVKISDSDLQEMPKNKYLKIIIADGILGFQVIKQKVFVN